VEAQDLQGRLIHSIPHFLVLALGILIFALIHPLLAVAYSVVVIASTVYFLKYICTRCASYGSKFCPSGYGILSGKLFPRNRDITFRKAFKRHIWAVAVQWFLPLGAGIAWIVKGLPDMDWILIATMMIFIIVAFVWLPIASRHKGCDVCPQRKDCPFKGK
jgi:hypothetical protein